MRELLFRAWDFDKKKMVQSDEYGFYIDKVYKQSLFMWERYYDDYERSAPIKYVMQYTGTKDKNRVKIFEGDIVKISKAKEDLVFNEGVINWNEKTLSFVIKHKHDYLTALYYPDNITVTGNIYENPELLPNS